MRAPSGAAFVNQAQAMELPGLAPSGFDPHAFARPGLRAPLTSGLWPARRPAGRLARPSTFTRWLIIGWSRIAPMTYPPPDRVQWAFAAYPRPGEAGPAVFHGPIARGQALDSPGLPRPTDADEQTTSGSAFQIEGLCCARFADG